VIESRLALAKAAGPVALALADWRKRRKARAAIPEPLWERMAALARLHRISRVAQTLNLNYTALKRHLNEGASAPAAGPGAPAFVEAPWPASPPPLPWVLELEDGCGAKLTLRLPAQESGAVLTLAQGVWRQRR